MHLTFFENLQFGQQISLKIGAGTVQTHMKHLVFLQKICSVWEDCYKTNWEHFETSNFPTEHLLKNT